ncbi:unnamed protein product [Penicillium nalgiovense]|nr:unnamed protein product [Penicillium salamii]CAG8049611.1 unnamed protein product [Penicillium salamii]CAG8889907.1 unnamed protein product [Penicillium salamii]CAG8904186.1 unnamed protein product [Penicillium nalgiovense]
MYSKLSDNCDKYGCKIVGLQIPITSSGLENRIFIPACATSPVTSGWESSLSHLDTNPTMGRIRKIPFTDQRQSFRSRLQRALSLSSSGSEDIWSPPGSTEGNTMEEESSLQENGSFSRNGITADDGQGSPPHTCSMGPRPEEELEQPGQANLTEDCNMIALQCAADLMQKALDNSNSWIATIRSDLEDIRSRLAVVETALEMMAKEGKNSTTEDNATRRTLRSQR